MPIEYDEGGRDGQIVKALLLRLPTCLDTIGPGQLTAMFKRVTVKVPSRYATSE